MTQFNIWRVLEIITSRDPENSRCAILIVGFVDPTLTRIIPKIKSVYRIIFVSQISSPKLKLSPTNTIAQTCIQKIVPTYAFLMIVAKPTLITPLQLNASAQSLIKRNTGP